MITPIDPRSLKIMHDEKIGKLEREIEMRRMVAERREAGISFESGPAWYARAAQWMQAKLSFGRHAASQPKPVEVVSQPCPSTPC